MSSVLEAVFVLFVMVGMLFALVRGWYTPEVVVFLSLLLVWSAGIISNAEALSGFNNPAVLVVGALFVVVASIENSRLAGKAARRVFGLTTSFTSGFLRLLLCVLAMSAFVNNTPVVALFIPVTRAWARTRGFNPEILLMPLSFASSFGGVLTTIGCGTNLVIQGLLYEASKSDEGVQPFGFFEPSYVGLPLAIVGIGYVLVAAPRLLGALNGGGGGGGIWCSRDRSEDLLTEVEVTADFELVGQSFELMLAVLGLPIDTLVKVRRRNPSADPADSAVPYSWASGFGDTNSAGRNAPLHGDDEESNGLSWAGRVGGNAAAAGAAAAAGGFSSTNGGGVGPFLLRRRLSYQRLASDGSGDAFEKGSDTAAMPCIEMATLRMPEAAAAAAGDRAVSINGDSSRVGVGSAHGGVSNPAGYEDIYAVPPRASVRAGDVLVLSCGREAMLEFQGSVAGRSKEGLKVFGVSGAKLPIHGTDFLELVVSRSSQFLGRTARLDSASFAASYGCSVVAFRLKGSTGGGVNIVGGDEENETTIEGGNGSGSDGDDDAGVEHLTACLAPTVCDAAAAAAGAAPGLAVDRVKEALLMDGDDSPTTIGGSLHPRTSTPSVSSPVPDESVPAGVAAPGKAVPVVGRRRGEGFAAGDVVVVLSSEGFLEKASSTREFLCTKRVGRLPEPTGWFHYFPLAIFAAMLAWVLVADVEVSRAAFAACAVLVLGGWIDAARAVGHINWSLLVLMGSALGFSKAISNSGLADYAGDAIRESGMSPSASLYVLFGFTMICTELISNNAAAALTVPIALSIARKMEADYKPFAMTVLLAASCSFLTPIGTPTNIMVWAPGGYKFHHFAKLGAPLSAIFLLAAGTAIPWVFPF